MAVVVWLGAAGKSGAQGVQKWTGPDGKAYYGNEASQGAGSADSGKGPAAKQATPEPGNVRDDVLRFVDDARSAFARCDLSSKAAAGYTQVQHDVIEMCLNQQVALREQTLKGLEDRLKGKPVALSTFSRFVSTWRSAISRMPPQVKEESARYADRKATIREEVDRAAVELTAQSF